MDPQTLTVDEVNRHVKLYLGIFAALLVLTGVTVAVAFVDLGHGANIALALVIATLKASLVGLFFMHLKWERRSIYALVALTFFFFAGMILLIVQGYWDTPQGTIQHGSMVEMHSPHAHGESDGE